MMVIMRYENRAVSGYNDGGHYHYIRELYMLDMGTTKYFVLRCLVQIRGVPCAPRYTDRLDNIYVNDVNIIIPTD